MDIKDKLPIFPRLIAILVLPTSLFRLLVSITVLQALIGGFTSDIPAVLSWSEGVSGFLAGWFGISASISLLKSQSKSIKQGWLCILFNTADIVVSFIGFQLSQMELPVFDTIGMGVIRIVFTLTFAIALLRAAGWFCSQSSESIMG